MNDLIAVTDCRIRPVFKNGKMVMCYASVTLNDCVRIDGWRAYRGEKRIYHPGRHGRDGLHYENVQFTGEKGQATRQMVHAAIRAALEQCFPGFTTIVDNPEWHTAGSYRKWKEQCSQKVDDDGTI